MVVVTTELSPPLTTPAPPGTVSQSGSGPSLSMPASSSANVFPAPPTTTAWCGSRPGLIIRKVVSPAGIVSGAPNAYSVAVMVTILITGGAARLAGLQAATIASKENGRHWVTNGLLGLMFEQDDAREAFELRTPFFRGE